MFRDWVLGFGCIVQKSTNLRVADVGSHNLVRPGEVRGFDSLTLAHSRQGSTQPTFTSSNRAPDTSPFDSHTRTQQARQVRSGLQSRASEA